MVNDAYRWWFDQFHDWHWHDGDGAIQVVIREFDDMHLVWTIGEHWYTMPLGNLFFNCVDWIALNPMELFA